MSATRLLPESSKDNYQTNNNNNNKLKGRTELLLQLLGN